MLHSQTLLNTIISSILLGIDWLNGQDSLWSNMDTRFKMLNQYMESMSICKDLSTKRIRLTVLSRLIFLNESTHGSKDHSILSRHMGPAHREPSSLDRLRKEESYIRAVFDYLKHVNDMSMHDTSSISAAMICLEALAKVEQPLPAVDWSRILAGLSQNIVLSSSCLHFSSLGTSPSLLTHFISTLTSLTTSRSSLSFQYQCEIVGDAGIGNLFSLSGLNEKFSKENPSNVILPPQRCMEIVQQLGDWLFDQALNDSDTNTNNSEVSSIYFFLFVFSTFL